MERYTLREGGRVLCPTERLEAALERLAAFEDLACGLEEEQQSLAINVRFIDVLMSVAILSPQRLGGRVGIVGPYAQYSGAV